MRVLFLNPFHGGSHAAVAEGYAAHSRHAITLLTLSQSGGWRWRMRGAAVTLARQLREQGTGNREQGTGDRHRGEPRVRPPAGTGGREQATGDRTLTRSSFDLILATDMLDLATFLGLTRDLTHGTPTALYFHENQLTYPLPAGRKPDLSLPWINYTSALAADTLLFNSDFHRRAFLDALPALVGRYHDHQERDLRDTLAAKARVLHPGVDLARLDDVQLSDADNRKSQIVNRKSPVILWNSRWEYDKQPQVFFDALAELERRGVAFRVVVAGEHIDPGAAEFVAARARFGSRALAWGYAPDTAAYRALLHQSDIVVSTALQEFFGISVVEALYCGCVPLLPRRLSYPEIIPPEHHVVCLYDDQADLVEKLIAIIGDLPALRARPFRAIAAQYDWSRMASQWDAALERVT